MKKEIKVYIASPYTKGWIPHMVNIQIQTASKLMKLGYFPYTPLLSHFQSIFDPTISEEELLTLDFCFVKTCNALLRIHPVDEKGKEIPSSGADREEAVAREHSIPIFHSIEDLNDHFKCNGYQALIDL